MNENDKKILLDMIDDLYQIEKQAKELYDDFLDKLEDKKEIQVVESIRDEEIKHMRICKDIKDIINNNE